MPLKSSNTSAAPSPYMTDAAIIKAHAYMLLGIALQLIGFGLNGNWLLIPGYIVAAMAGYALAAKSGTPCRWITSAGLLVPGVQFVAAHVLDGFATAYLRARNIKVGLLGAYWPTWVALLGLGVVVVVAVYLAQSRRVVF